MFIPFQNLNIWKSSIDISKEIYLLTNQEAFSKDRWLKDQIRRSAVSIASNIAEWNWRASKEQYKYFLKIARWSCSELYTQIVIAWKIGYIEKEEYMTLLEKTTILWKQISTFLKTLN